MAVDRVDALLERMDHPRVAEIETLRALLLAVDSRLSESVKWNAPSYAAGDDHRLTMRLQPGARVELVLHRGSTPSAEEPPAIDGRGIVRWVAPDRGVIEFANATDLARKSADVRAVARAWLEATL